MSGGSYISSNDQRPHFGLGDSTDGGTAEIHWPSGFKEYVRIPAVDRIFTITEGKGITGVLCATKVCSTGREAVSSTAQPLHHPSAITHTKAQ
jgi:hypothetical protein